MGFNVLDLQGDLANRDYKLINDLLRHMPQAYIFVLITCNDYVKQVFEQIDPDLKHSKLLNQMYVVTKTKTRLAALQIKIALRMAIPGFNEKT